MWLTNKDGEIINKPSPIFNHLMDAVRYSLYSLRSAEEREEYEEPEYIPRDEVIGI